MKPVYIALIIVVAVALLIFGYFLMKQLDCFLAENKKRISAGIGVKQSDGLRIAFENPVIISSVSEGLELLSKKNPDCKLYFFIGTAEQIHIALENNRIDIGFVLLTTRDDAAVPLRKTDYYSDTLGCSVELLEAGQQYIGLLSRNDKMVTQHRKMLKELIESIGCDNEF